MTDILNTGKSALFAFQRALATTSNNIANVNTEGYARQRVDLESVPANRGLYHQPGGGVRVVGIQRMADEFATARVNLATSAYEEQQTHQAMASRLDNLVAIDGSSVGPAVSDFFNAIQDANADPTSIATREVVLDKTNQLAERFQSLQGQLDDAQTEVNERTRAAVSVVGELAQSIALVNKQVSGISSSINPGAVNDLLDKRDRLTNELSKYVDIDTTTHESGALNVFMGKGIALVIGGVAQELKTVADDTYPERVQIQIGKEGFEQVISSRLQGGEIGGLAEFANQTLRPAMTELGRLAVTMADAANQQHGRGLDLNGEAGANLFEVPAPQVFASGSNAGSGTMSAEINDTKALEATDYLVRFDGANYTATRSSDGAQAAGALPLDLDGLSLNMTGTPVVGDTFVVSATGRAAALIDSNITDPDKLAFAGQLATQSSIANTGESRISSAKVLDAENGSLQDPIDIVFTSDSTYDIIDVGTGNTLFSDEPYSSGETISLNGWEVSISGNAVNGDTHRIEPNIIRNGEQQ